MIAPLELICAFFLDLAIGDPRWLPHPVRIIGKGITGMESFLRGHFRRFGEKISGVFLVLGIVIPAFVITFAIQKLLITAPAPPFRIIGLIILLYLMSTTLALHELLDSARRVIDAVKSKSITNARRNLSMIVGRDTDRLGEEGVLRATIETLAENLSDGFIAPLFYLVIGGLPCAVAYKAINTLDSMVGYKNEQYLRFGWAAAKLDDIANYVPARLTGIGITAAVFMYFLIGDPRKAFTAAGQSFTIMLRDGRNHSSPNSGIPEAAMAGGIGVRLGGPSTYGGILVEKPFIGNPVSDDYLSAAERTLTIVSVSAWIAVLCAAGILILR